MSKFVPIQITGPARAQKPAKLRAKYVARINPVPSEAWVEAFNSREWTFNAMREQPPKVVFFGERNERVGIGLSSVVIESPAGTISTLMDELEAAVDEVNDLVLKAEAEQSAARERTAAEMAERQAEAEARIAADWAQREQRRNQT